jgi:hypothetical protein
VSPGESLRTPLSRNRGWRDPASIAEDAGWTGLPRRLGEWVVMKWAAVVVLGFVLEVGAVIWLARSNTARWERDHRAARAAIRAREEAGLRVRAAALVAQHVPHPHLVHLPHVHLSPRVVDRLTHTRGTLHRPHLHLPHLNLHLHLTRRRPEVPEAPVPAAEEPVLAAEEPVLAAEEPVLAAEDSSTPAQQQPAS